MHRQVGDLVGGDDGIALRGLLVRHRVMPNGIGGTEPVAGFLAAEISRNTYTHIMAQYRPCGQAVGDKRIGRPLTGAKFAAAVSAARAAGLTLLDRR